MKRLLLSLVLINFVQPAFASGGKEGGAGILLAAEFATTGRKSLEILAGGDTSLNLAEILAAISNTKVIPVDELCYVEPVFGKRYCEDAHYDAKHGIILFAHKRWDQIGLDEKLVLSSHEFLRAAGLEGEDYRLSGRFLMGRLSQCQARVPKEELKCAEEELILRSQKDQLMSELMNLMMARRAREGKQ